MKMKKLISLLLAAVMCLSMLMTSCGIFGGNEEEDEEDAAAQKQVIIENFEQINLKDIVTTTLDQLENQQISYEDLLKEFNAELDCQASFDGETMSFYTGISDGLLKVVSPEGESGYVFINDKSYVAISPSHGVLEINVEDVESSSMPAWTDLETYLTDDILAALDSFTIEAPTEKQLKKSGDFFVLTNKYYEGLAESVVDLIAQISYEMQGYYPSEEEKAEALEQIIPVVEGLNLEIGFAVSGDNIVGIKLGIDPDMDMIESIIGGGAVLPESPSVGYPEYDEDVYVEEEKYYAYSAEKNGDSFSVSAGVAQAKYKLSLELMLTDDLSNIKSFKAEADMSYVGGSLKASINLESIIKDGTVMGANVAVDLDVPEIPYTSESSGDENGYSSTQYYAACNAKINGFIDFSNYENVDAQIIDLEASLTVTPTRKQVTKYNYSDDSYHVETSKDVSDLDPVSCSVSLNAYVAKLGSMSAELKVKATAEGETVEIFGDGYISWMEAENFGYVDSTVANMFNNPNVAEQIADLEARIENGRFNLGYSDYTVWYDEMTGLYVLFYYGSQYDYSILTGLPTDISFVQIYN